MEVDVEFIFLTDTNGWTSFLFGCCINSANKLADEVIEGQTGEADEKSEVATDGSHHVCQPIRLQLLLPEGNGYLVFILMLTVQKSLASWRWPSGCLLGGLRLGPDCQSLPSPSLGGVLVPVWCSCKEGLGFGTEPSLTAHSLMGWIWVSQWTRLYSYLVMCCNLTSWYRMPIWLKHSWQIYPHQRKGCDNHWRQRKVDGISSKFRHPCWSLHLHCSCHDYVPNVWELDLLEQGEAQIWSNLEHENYSCTRSDYLTYECHSTLSRFNLHVCQTWTFSAIVQRPTRRVKSRISI